jgi:hypothetical protein
VDPSIVDSSFRWNEAVVRVEVMMKIVSMDHLYLVLQLLRHYLLSFRQVLPRGTTQEKSIFHPAIALPCREV